MMTAKANINSLILDMKHQVAIIKVSGCMEKSAQGIIFKLNIQ